MRTYKIDKNTYLNGLGIVIDGWLVISDLHIGYEEYLREKGILLPDILVKKMKENLKKIYETMKEEGDIKGLVIDGDLKHEFGRISAQEWRDSFSFIDYAKELFGRVILVKGNHDTILNPIAERKDIEIVERYEIGKYIMIHGHKMVNVRDFEDKVVVIGHEHPAIAIGNEIRKEIYKCFLLAKNSKIIVLPSFFPLVEGHNLEQENFISPLLKKYRLDDFRKVLVDDSLNLYLL